MIKIAVVEDEEIFRQQLESYIDRYKKENNVALVVHYFSDGTEITDGYSAQYDIILMDIEMKLMNGMEAAEEIRRLDKDVVIMFITNMTQYAIRGYQVDALDYVVKPVEYFSFSQKLGRALERASKHNMKKYISLQREGNIQKIEIADLRYVESQGHTLFYFLRNGVIENRGVMKALEQSLSDYGFYRCNKGCLVNLAYVDAIKDNNCVIGDAHLPISRGKRKEFMEVLVEYMSGAGK